MKLPPLSLLLFHFHANRPHSSAICHIRYSAVPLYLFHFLPLHLSRPDEEEDRVCGLHFGRHINFESRPSLPSPIVRALSVRESISYSERFSIAWHEFCGSGGIHATSVRWADVHLSFPLPASLVSSAHCGGPAFSVHSSISSSSLCLSLSFHPWEWRQMMAAACKKLMMSVVPSFVFGLCLVCETDCRVG